MSDNNLIVGILQDVRADQKEMRKEIHTIDQTLLRNTLSLEEHMRRTDELEKLNSNILSRVDDLEDIFRFFKNFCTKALKIAAGITTVVVAITGVMKLINYLFDK